MPYARERDKVAHSARYYEANKRAAKKRARQWKVDNPLRYAWLGQRHTSKQRGVEFNLTFEQFKEFWGSDFCLRGKRNHDLQMCRYGDNGHYELGNIYKATKSENKAGPREKDEGLHEDIPY